MSKLRFEFTILPGSDGKTNVCCITSITTSDNKSYAIPEEWQSVGHHKEIMKTAVYTKVKNSLTKRYQVRRVWITMGENLAAIYIDEEGNIQFGDRYLEEISQEQPTTANPKESESLQKLLEKVLESSQGKQQNEPNLKCIADKFVIEKFTSKHANTEQWMDTFENECTRFQIADDKKIEILRIFLDKSCADWYSSMVIKMPKDSQWNEWKNKFCESFANKGWNPVTDALLFKYREGSLPDQF